MKEIKILYFGVLAELSGQASESLAFSGSLEDLKLYLIERYPELAKHRFQFAVNQQITPEYESLSAGDEIALLPPFTGG